MSKSCQKVVIKKAIFFKKVVKKLLKSCQKVVKKLSKGCQKVSKNSEMGRRRRRRRRRFVAPRPGTTLSLLVKSGHRLSFTPFIFSPRPKNGYPPPFHQEFPKNTYTFSPLKKFATP
jgi:hypothetical protein